jgi:hypothetical protein
LQTGGKTLSDVSSPKATRQSRPRWLDPKLFLGILLVLASMALGARVVAQADQTVEVWALRDDVDLASTVPLRQSALVAKRVQFTSQDDADLYVSAREPVPEGARMIRAVSAGELLPRNSWTNKPDSELNDAPIPVAPGLLPRGLQQGDRIDIYFVPANDDTFPPKEGVLAASDVVLVELPSAESFGGGAEASATIRVAPDELSEGMPITQLVANASNAKAVIIKHVAPEPR